MGAKEQKKPRITAARVSAYRQLPSLKYLRLHELDIQYSRQLRRLRRILAQAEKKALKAVSDTTQDNAASAPKSLPRSPRR